MFSAVLCMSDFTGNTAKRLFFKSLSDPPLALPTVPPCRKIKSKFFLFPFLPSGPEPRLALLKEEEEEGGGSKEENMTPAAVYRKGKEGMCDSYYSTSSCPGAKKKRLFGAAAADMVHLKKII